MSFKKKRGRYANLTCEERQIEKEQIIVPTGRRMQRIHFLIQEKA